MVLYVVASVVLERDAVAHLTSVCVCDGGSSFPAAFSVPTAFMWALVWWPHAILHGQNPVVTHAIWTPGGLDLARGTSIPALAVAAAPLTAIAGPVVAFNVLSILAPVIGAWFAYRLCLYVTKAPAASVLGGYLFGFSTYELAHLQGLLHTIFTFGPPAATLLTLKRLDGVISSRRYAALMAFLLVVQLLISTEIFLTLTCMGAVALGSAWFFSSSDARRRIVGLFVPLLVAYTAAAIVCSPYLYYALARGSGYSQGVASGCLADALGFFVPTAVAWLGGHRFAGLSMRFPGNLAENGMYLGLPIVGMLVIFALQWWRTRSAKILLSVGAVAVLWSLGPHLYIGGTKVIPLPWRVLGVLPLFNQLAPVRVVIYLALVTSLAAAL